jgi:hypothetical protein
MHLVHVLWFRYEWPSDLGNGPESITELIVLGIAGAYFIPRVRKFFKRHFEAAKELAERHHEEHLALIAKHHKEAMRKADLHHAEIMTGQTPPPKNGRDAKGRFTKT